jgi:ABC-type antimicrobial peptide transport system permease subunit
MHRHLSLLRAAAENVARLWRVYAVAASGLILALTLLLCGVAIGEGLKQQALAGIDAGGDVYCTWDRFGRDAALPRERVGSLAAIEGVLRAVPRIVGRLPIGDELAVVVGIPLRDLAAETMVLDGHVPSSGAEVLVGRELALAAGLAPGRRLMLETQTTSRIYTVAGVFSARASPWSSRVVVCDIEDAAVLFEETESVSDIVLYARPGYVASVAEAVQELDPRIRVQTRDSVRQYVLRGMNLREGAFTVLAALALAVAIPTFALFAFLGHAPRRREIGILKAEGWRTSDVLEMVALENLLVSLIAAGASVSLAALWLRVFRAPLVAPFFLPELPAFPRLEIPARFVPLPLLLALVFSLVVTMTGSLYTTWRTATRRPAEALR